MDDVAATNLALILAGLAPDPYPSVEREREGLGGPGQAHRRVQPWPRQREKAAAEGHTPRPDWSWQDDAHCRGEDLVLFFGPDGEQRAEREIREAKAKRICGRCPVRSECLDYAVSRPEKYGLYGGLNEDERANERRRRMRSARAA